MIGQFLCEMVGFFDEIARPGWIGPSLWYSEFDEVTVGAKAASDGEVTLDFRLWWSKGDELDNEREGQLVVRRDELPEFARRLRAVSGAPGSAPA